jgi:hypothetical protein
MSEQDLLITGWSGWKNAKDWNNRVNRVIVVKTVLKIFLQGLVESIKFINLV